MIRSYRRAADAADLKAMTQGKGASVRNVLMVSSPIGAVLFLGMDWLTRSYVVALLVAGAIALASIWSNVRFFRTVAERGRSGSEQSTVEVMEVEATRVGQWLMEVPRFPSLSFRLFRWADDGKPIRIEATGRTVEAEPSTVALQGHYTNGDIEVFRAQPQTLQQDLENAFGRGAG